MHAERRVEQKRIFSSRPIELVADDGSVSVAGTTDNLSDEGIGARVKQPLPRGANVLIRLSWDAGRPPIEQIGHVVWIAPGPSGDWDVGLRVQMDNESSVSESAKTDNSGEVLRQGETVRILVGKQVLEVRIQDVEVDSVAGAVRIIALPTGDNVVLDAGAGEDIFAQDEVDWAPHPFRDAWRWIVEHAVFVSSRLRAGQLISSVRRLRIPSCQLRSGR